MMGVSLQDSNDVIVEDDVADAEGSASTEDVTVIGELRAKKRQLEEEIQKKVSSLSTLQLQSSARTCSH